MKKSTQNRLVIACQLALNEIHNPGTSRDKGLDIVALLDGVIKEAAPNAPIAKWVEEEMRT